MTQLVDLLLSATPDDLKQLDRQFNPRTWVTDLAGVTLPKSGRVDFTRYPYMSDVYADLSPEITIIKGAQLGFSTWAMCRTLWMLTTFSCTVIYTFPTREQVSEYTAARIDPIIKQTPYLMSRIEDVNSVKLKKFRRDLTRTDAGVSLVYFQGAAKEADAIAVDADLVVHDEEDKSNPQVINQYTERLTASRFKYRARLSTPTIPGKGVDRSYKGTDQMKWLVTCSACNAEFELRFPKEEGDPRSNIEPHTLAEVYQRNIPPRYICHLCKATLTDIDRGSGRWVPLRPETGLPRGYQISQMAAPWISAYDILKGRSDAIYESDFWNLKIGMAWMAGTTSMTRAVLEARATDNRMQLTGFGCFMGVDVGQMLDIIIEQYDEAGQAHVVKIARVPWDPAGDFEELDQFMRDFDIQVCVMDRLPETGMARRFASRWNDPGVTRVYLCSYREETSNATSREVKFIENDPDVRSDDSSSVKAPRNELLTQVSNELVKRLWLPMVDGSPEYEAFFDHCWNAKRTPHYDDGADATKTVATYVWENTGPDHLFHALAYAYLARLAPRPLAPPIHGIISSSRGDHRDSILPSDKVAPPYRTQRIG